MAYRVILVEDDRATAESVIGFLELRGIEVVWCDSVAEARRDYVRGWADVLLVDYDLGDGVGTDFLAAADREAWTILWSGLDRSRELAAAGLDRVTIRNKVNMPEVLAEIVAAKDEAYGD